MQGVALEAPGWTLVLVYAQDVETLDEPLAAVVPDPVTARHIENYAARNIPGKRMRWEVIPAYAERPLGLGDTVILVSDGGETDDPGFDVSQNAPDPVGLAAFTDRAQAEAYAVEATRDHIPTVRLRTLAVGWLAPVLDDYRFPVLPGDE